VNYISLSQTMNPSQQHIVNQSAVFHYLRETGSTYRNQISMALGISLPSVSRALNALMTKGFVELIEYRKNDQARSVPYYRITIKDDFMVSLDLLKGVIAARSLDRLFSISYFKLDKGKSVLEDLESIIRKYVETDLEKSCSSIKSICIGSPGIVDVEAGKVLKAIFHPGLEGVPIKDALAETFRCSVFVDNVVNIAAYANYCEYDKAIKNIVSCDIGVEIGTGLLINGSIYRGDNYMAGETGFYTDNLADPKINYKRTHTFRALSADMSLRKDGREIDSTQLDEGYCLRRVAELFTDAHNGDEIAKFLIDGFVRKIALMLNKVEVLLNPRLIVIGGDVCQMPYSEEVFLSKLNEYFRRLSQIASEICYSKYGPLVTLYGAGEMALDLYFREKFPYIMGT